MQCANTDDCFDRIRDYFDGPKLDRFLLVNVQNFADYQEVLRRQYDGGREYISVSDFCEPDDFPFIEGAIAEVLKKDFSVLSGLSQALMLRSEKKLDEVLNDVLYRPTHGRRCVILLLGCENYLKKFLERDERLSRSVILVKGEPSPLPKILLSAKDFHLSNATTLHGVKALLHHLERENASEPHLVSAKSRESFGESCYQISDAPSAYEWLKDNFSEIRDATTASFGTDDEWSTLASICSNYSSFMDFVIKTFGSTTNLSGQLRNVMRSADDGKKWLLWLALKIFGDKSNNYLSRVLQSSKTASDFPERVYLELASVDASEKDFLQLYDERKILLEDFEIRPAWTNSYRDALVVRQKDEIFYLTDKSDTEKYEFVRCLAQFDYSAQEINRAVKQMSKSLASYMTDYDFKAAKWTTGSSAALAPDLTAYFKEYKLQKLTNRIHPEFRDKVEEYAKNRPYNGLTARGNLIPKNLAKDRCKPFFLDALGVEYLGFIVECCKNYGMVAEISVGRCELPSTTEVNKKIVEDSCSSWGEEILKINALDNIKHDGKEFDFQKCPYPIHLFEELNVIDKLLEEIYSELSQKKIDKALIVSDHGASRLAVLFSEMKAPIDGFDEQGEKSGRYVRVSEDSPKNVSFMDYEEEFAVVANYDRVRGSRRASVEVHGGASLEEVLVPVIVLSLKPTEQEISLDKSYFELGRQDVLSLDLSFTVTLEHPRLFIDGKYYDCESSNSHHAKFTIPEIKKGTHVAQVFDGDKDLMCKLEFTVKSKMATEKKLL